MDPTKVKFNPLKIRYFNAESLVETLRNKRPPNYQKKFIEHEMEMVMRRVYHVAHGTSTEHRAFPIRITRITNNKGSKSWHPSGSLKFSQDVNCIGAYKQIAKKLKKSGFDVEVYLYQPTYLKGNSKAHDTVCSLTVTGVKRP